MTTRKQIRENPPPTVHWGYYNLGRLIGVATLRKDAIKKAEQWTEKPWAEIDDHIEIHKILVSKVY